MTYEICDQWGRRTTQEKREDWFREDIKKAAGGNQRPSEADNTNIVIHKTTSRKTISQIIDREVIVMSGLPEVLAERYMSLVEKETECGYLSHSEAREKWMLEMRGIR